MRRVLHVIRNSDGSGRAAVVVLVVAWLAWMLLTQGMT